MYSRQNEGFFFGSAQYFHSGEKRCRGDFGRSFRAQSDRQRSQVLMENLGSIESGSFCHFCAAIRIGAPLNLDYWPSTHCSFT